MNRIDKTAEPSMEDILASIRRIISDEDRPDEAPAASNGRHRGEVEPARFESQQSLASSADSLPEDEVFDLTDDFVVADASSSNVSPESLHAVIGDRFGAPSSNGARSEPPRKSQGFGSSAFRFAEGETVVRTEPSKEHKRASVSQPTPASQPARPSWSRRELPSQPAPSRPVEPAVKRETVATKTTSSPPWAHPNAWEPDVKIPVPDGGPVSLVDDRVSPQNRVPGAFETAANSLAQNAVQALDDGELTQAVGIDFDEIEDDDKARMSETIAHVLSTTAEAQKTNSSSDAEIQASVLDQVLSRDFLRSQEQTPDETRPGAEPWIPSMHEESAELSPHPYNRADVQGAMTKPATASPQRQSREVAPASQAQFVGLSNPTASESGVRSLEDSVREMLRPMLIQWLNENMPRILEDAIRKEISSRGIGGLIPDPKS